MNKEWKVAIDAARWPELEHDAMRVGTWVRAAAVVAGMFAAMYAAAFLVTML